ncbi:MAG: hypothetical protein ACK5D5_09175 [Bacteroidota bacterium]|jgi:hypothetical protein
MKTILKFLLLPVSILIFQSCYYDNLAEMRPGLNLNNNCDSTVSIVSYSNHIVPILNNSCGTNNTCHGSNNISSVDLSNYSSVSTFAQGYFLFHVVEWTPNYAQMPKGSQTKISACNRALIRRWIEAGAPNN